MTLKLTAVGVGPGAPDLITVRGVEAIRAAGVIFTPQSRDGGASIAYRIAQQWIDPARQQVISLPLPMTRDADQLLPAWQAAADAIAEGLSRSQAAQGSAHGVYIILGDPLLYGTFIYIWQQIRQRHPAISVEVVPGITSFAAGAAAGLMPLAATADRLAILPGSYEDDPAALLAVLERFQTVILLKAGPALPHITATLAQAGLLKHALYVERVGLPGERVLPLAGLHVSGPSEYLSLVIVRRA